VLAGVDVGLTSGKPGYRVIRVLPMPPNALPSNHLNWINRQQLQYVDGLAKLRISKLLLA
jgi:hypothetical protein